MRDSRKRRIRFFRRFFKRKLKQWQWVWSDVRFNEKSLEEQKEKFGATNPLWNARNVFIGGIMDSISLENKMSFPLQLTLTGSNFEETKNLPLKDLVLYLEREFKKLEEEFHWLDLQLEIEVDQKNHTSGSLTIFLTTKDYGCHFIVQDKVEPFFGATTSRCSAKTAEDFIHITAGLTTSFTIAVDSNSITN